MKDINATSRLVLSNLICLQQQHDQQHKSTPLHSSGTTWWLCECNTRVHCYSSLVDWSFRVQWKSAVLSMLLSAHLQDFDWSLVWRILKLPLSLSRHVWLVFSDFITTWIGLYISTKEQYGSLRVGNIKSVRKWVDHAWTAITPILIYLFHSLFKTKTKTVARFYVLAKNHHLMMFKMWCRYVNNKGEWNELFELPIMSPWEV